jgi:subtilisin family serine protease
MTRAFALALVLAALAAPGAHAQLGVPLPTPDLPLPNVGETVNRTLENAPLRDLRRLRVEDLLRTHRRELEADPHGQPIVRSQILALGMSAEAMARAEAMGLSVVSRDALGDDTLVTLRAPRGMSTRRALSRLREADANSVYDFDHLHLESGAAGQTVLMAQASDARAPPRIGMIDSGVPQEGGYLAALAAYRTFAGARAPPGGHGHVVAARLLNAAPGARLYVADIYGGAPTGGSSSALARALAWLSEENAPVINVSLVGPRNRIVETVVARLVARGHAIVAAVGNDGPAAAPLYPAAYPGVIGVTAVDGRGRVLMEAGRGAHVDFAALGIVAARVRGTSYAAPIVAGLLAIRLNAPDPDARERALTTLRAAARDLGAIGRDPVYGDGFLQAR